MARRVRHSQEIDAAMKTVRSLLAPVIVVAVLVGLIAAMVYFRSDPSADQSAAGDWTCSMHPQIRRPKPGQCPICGMDLIPVAELTKEQARIENRAGIFVEPIAYRELAKEIRTVGKLDYNEQQVAYIPARINGRVVTVFADFVGMEVRKETHLIKILSPDLHISLQALLSDVQDGNKAGAENARVRLRTLGMLDAQI